MGPVGEDWKFVMEEGAGVSGVAAELELNLLGDAVEVAEAAHEGVAQAAEVGAILHFLGENVTGVDLAGNVKDGDGTVLYPFTGAVLAEF